MTEFVERLPWRLAALAGLLVGGASLIAGTDLWISLIRVGAAFVIFAGLGIALRALLRTPPPSAPPAEPATEPTDEAERGSQVDQKTPEMTVDDL